MGKMMMYVWWGSDRNLRVSKTPPTLLDDNDPEYLLHREKVVGDVSTLAVSRDSVGGILPFLPQPGIIGYVSLHDLWGRAHDLPYYDKSVWIMIQQVVE